MKQLLYYGLRAYTSPLANRFQESLVDPVAAQNKLLEDLVKDLRKTDYGKHYGIQSTDDFKANIPLVNYDDIATWMDKQRETEGRVLVASNVKFYEKTSGSTGPAKYIPYTKALRQSFTRMFLLWAHDLISQVSGLGDGKLYFSVSPKFDEECMTEQGIPVGLDDDVDYLGGLWRILLSPFLHSDPVLGKIREPEAFKKALCFSLLQSKDLETISVWNPSFLTLVLQWIEQHKELVIAELGHNFTPLQKEALKQRTVDWQKIWPKLKVISCWADANAQPLAEKLKKQFPDVLIQGKGLLATEAPMTIPMIGIEGGVPLITETYFEFLDSSNELLTIGELNHGARYEIVISQRGGLYRYRMGDEVQVADMIGNTPTLRFVGRNNRTSDLVGEKLNESFVRDVIEKLPLADSGFRSLMAVRNPNDGYVLVLDKSDVDLSDIEMGLENGLKKAYHYRHARALGQLNAAKVSVIPNVEEIMSSQAIAQGKTLGDMKQNYLILSDDGLQNALGLV